MLRLIRWHGKEAWGVRWERGLLIVLFQLEHEWRLSELPSMRRRPLSPTSGAKGRVKQRDAKGGTASSSIIQSRPKPTEDNYPRKTKRNSSFFYFCLFFFLHRSLSTWTPQNDEAKKEQWYFRRLNSSSDCAWEKNDKIAKFVRAQAKQWRVLEDGAHVLLGGRHGQWRQKSWLRLKESDFFLPCLPFGTIKM